MADNQYGVNISDVNVAPENQVVAPLVRKDPFAAADPVQPVVAPVVEPPVVEPPVVAVVLKEELRKGLEILAGG